jgi:hypothetical protein
LHLLRSGTTNVRPTISGAAGSRLDNRQELCLNDYGEEMSVQTKTDSNKINKNI